MKVWRQKIILEHVILFYYNDSTSIHSDIHGVKGLHTRFYESWRKIIVNATKRLYGKKP